MIKTWNNPGELPGIVGIPGYYPGILSRDPWDCGTTRDWPRYPHYPGILTFLGSMGLHAWWVTGTVLGILGYLVSWDPFNSMPTASGTTRECLGYPRILSISGSWDSMPGGTTLDCPGYPGILSTYGSPHLVGLPGTVLGIPGYLAPPSFSSLLVWKSGRGPGIFSHVSDVRIERMVERV